ncbi:MAG: class I SAM-dependent methyltransferase [Pseudomonadota bacterium]|jgi:protein-L-isoaspartate O-methyltransferase
MSKDYVHGYATGEVQRLHDQASALIDLLHFDTAYPSGHKVLEAGCGVGAQTIFLAKHSPGALITAVDISEESLSRAKSRVQADGIGNVNFEIQDVNALTYTDNSFDHVFVCFLLEHMKDPVNVLLELKRVLKAGGTMTVIEGDHGSAYFYPDSHAARKAISCQIKLQALSGGNANLGRGLYPLMIKAGFQKPYVTPRVVYADESRPALAEGFTRNTFTAMVKGVREKVIEGNLMDISMFDQGIRDLYRTAEPGGTFNYTFFKAQAVK